MFKGCHFQGENWSSAITGSEYWLSEVLLKITFLTWLASCQAGCFFTLSATLLYMPFALYFTMTTVFRSKVSFWRSICPQQYILLFTHERIVFSPVLGSVSKLLPVQQPWLEYWAQDFTGNIHKNAWFFMDRRVTSKQGQSGSRLKQSQVSPDQ